MLVLLQRGLLDCSILYSTGVSGLNCTMPETLARFATWHVNRGTVDALTIYGSKLFVSFIQHLYAVLGHN